MLRITLGCLFTLLALYGSAQTVSGVVKDSLTKAPLVFATIAIRSAGMDSALRSAVTDEKGRFTLVKLPPGNFEITLTSVGYNSNKLPITVGAAGSPMNLGTLFLSPRTELLKEVVIDGKRALIEEKLDRTVDNVERDKSLTGGDATDAMRRVPLLSVDIDGNVTLRGSANIKVLINGRPSTITANNLADALKQIPLDQIRSIEVITSPSVKYDADGSAGIINIVLKQDRLDGILINPDMAIGTRASFLGINGAYNNKKMAFSIGGFGRATYNVTGTFNNAQTVGSEAIIQQAATRKNELTDNYNMGWDYDLDKNNFLNASVRYSQFNSHNYQDNLVTDFYNGSVPDSTLFNQVQLTGRSGTIDATVDFTHTFARAQREFSFLTLISRTDGTNGFTNAQQSPPDDSLIGRVGNDDRSSNQEITLQADYQTPLDSNQLLEFGGKYIIREVISNYNYESAAGNDPFAVEASPELTNRFTYHQNVTAGYLEYTLTTRSPFSFRAGARYEYAAISAGLQIPGVAMPEIPSYGVFVPAVNIGWRLKNGKLIKLAFTRRIQRPSIQFLNPNVVASDPGNIATGNPALGPEYSDNIELGYNTSIKDMSIGFSGFFRRTTNAIESVSLPVAGGDTVERTYANIGKESTGGLNVFANLDLGQKLSLSGGADLYYTELENAGLSAGAGAAAVAGRNTGWVVGARLSGGYTFTKGWSLYLYSYYRGSQVLLQGYQTGFPYYSLTLKRELPKKRGTIGVGAENFLSRGISVTTNVNSAALSQSTTNLYHTLSLRIYMSFTFGKLKVERAERQKKAISNDDLKKG
jgi:outer membrane receptor protein involved in Fe transport